MGKRQRRRLREQDRLAPPRPDLDLHRDPTGEATARLRQLVEQLGELQREIDTEIDLLYSWGFDWSTIATALGVTRQAARQRFLRRHSTIAKSLRE
jgi:DNA-directed RNA polymerase specialized sigma24 family protein